MNADAWNKKGEEYWQNKDIDNALKSFKEATKLEPENSAALYNEGAALIHLSKNSEGKDVIEKAIAIRDNDAVGYIWLAIADYRLGDVNLAKSNIQKALSIEPDEKFALLVQGYIDTQAEIVLG